MVYAIIVGGVLLLLLLCMVIAQANEHEELVERFEKHIRDNHSDSGFSGRGKIGHGRIPK